MHVINCEHLKTAAFKKFAARFIRLKIHLSL